MKKSKLRRDMKALSKLGVAARAAKKAALAELLEWPLVEADGRPRDLASPADCQVVASWVARQIATGYMSATAGKVISVVISAWLRASDKAGLAEDAKAAVALLEELSGTAKSAAAMRRRGREALQRKRGRTTETTTILEEATDGRATENREAAEVDQAATRGLQSEHVERNDAPARPAGAPDREAAPIDARTRETAGAIAKRAAGAEARAEADAAPVEAAIPPVMPAAPKLKPASERRPGDPGWPPTPQEYLDEVRQAGFHP